MSIKIENLRTLSPVAVEDLQQLQTGRILERFRQLRRLQISYEASDWSDEERDAVEAAGLIAFKSSDLWEKAFADVKGVLSEREHLPRGSKQKRQQEAHNKQNR